MKNHAQFIDRYAQLWFVIFIIVHVIAWTLAPTFIRYNLPLDSIEGTAWAQELQWGYDKNPFLNSWLTELALLISNQQEWSIYFFSQCSVALSLCAVWALARKMLSAPKALLSVLILETVQYFNLHAIDFNDNTVELGLWATTVYVFYIALTVQPFKQRCFAWTMTGILAALALMAKYYTLALLAALALFLIFNRTARKTFFTLPPYIGLCVFCLIITPHLFWLHTHDYITVRYVFARASVPHDWTNHILFPLKFVWQQLEVILPAIITLSIFSFGKKNQIKEATELSSFQLNFLYFIALGPFLLTATLSLVFGITLRAGWGMPLQSFWGILLIVWFNPVLTIKKIYAIIIFTFLLMMALVTAYILSLTHSNTATSANFPGRLIATTIAKEWHRKFGTKLDYVAGSRWLGGNISFYSPDRPHVFMEWDQRVSSWIDYSTLRKKGGVFIWDISAGEILPPTIQQRFPGLLKSQELHFQWLRDPKRKLTPIRIGIALLPPEAS